ncbi:hypothetical protein [Fibrella aquatilis]|uniref:Peptidase C-terminal archaeal/bacterial domain-containing protein n=1 Tax=Fibrella aquatilis TaxID=2817059 RepID=A0A939K0M4_9BACT|nr:hypothetical protein [Fibrella aquatilis]MBO0934344.1 hypothetical protein [Fibrella aquatilis]
MKTVIGWIVLLMLGLLSGNASPLDRKVIQGSRTGVGAGGTTAFENSPRNDHFTFEVTQDNAAFTVSIKASMDAVVRMYSETGQLVAGANNTCSMGGRINRAGTYSMVVFTPRYVTGTYEAVPKISEVTQSVNDPSNSLS